MPARSPVDPDTGTGIRNALRRALPASSPTYPPGDAAAAEFEQLLEQLRDVPDAYRDNQGELPIPD